MPLCAREWLSASRRHWLPKREGAHASAWEGPPGADRHLRHPRLFKADASHCAAMAWQTLGGSGAERSGAKPCRSAPLPTSFSRPPRQIQTPQAPPAASRGFRLTPQAPYDLTTLITFLRFLICEMTLSSSMFEGTEILIEIS